MQRASASIAMKFQVRNRADLQRVLDAVRSNPMNPVYLAVNPGFDMRFEAFQQFHQLQRLEFYECKLCDEDLKPLPGFTKLVDLTIFGRSQRITDVGFGYLSSTWLTKLVLCHAVNFTDATIRLLPQGLDHLNVSMCPNITSRGLQMLSQYCPKLTELFLAETQFDYAALASLAPLIGLRQLHACNTLLTDTSFPVISRFDDLRYLDLSDCQLDGHGLPAMLQSLIELTHLSLSGTRVYLPNLSAMQPTLTYLNLRACRIQKFNFDHLEHLESLNLRNCEGVTNHSLRHLPPTLRKLDLANCQGVSTLKALAPLGPLEYLSVQGTQVPSHLHTHPYGAMQCTACLQYRKKCRRCSRCLSSSLYCSRECQKEDWPEHKTACRLHKKA